MNTLELPRVLSRTEADAYIGQEVPDLEPTHDGETLFLDGESGEPVLCYCRLPFDLAVYRAAVRAIKFSTILRGSGTRNTSRTFGMAGRSVILRREGCKPASLHVDQPDECAVLLRVAQVLGDFMKDVAPTVWEKDRETVSRVHEDWRMVPGSLWTSGNINLSSALPYHRDRANFPTWTGMPVLRRGMRGGRLHLPEYDVTLPCRDGWVVFFPGNELVHGVTPMRPVDDSAYRYSVVHYAIRGMKDCYSAAIEQIEAARRRTQREEHPGEIQPGHRGRK